MDTYLYSVFVYCHKPNLLELSVRDSQGARITTERLFDGIVVVFCLDSNVSLSGHTFMIDVVKKESCFMQVMNPFTFNILEESIICIDTSIELRYSNGNPLFYILPSLYTIYPNYMSHFSVSSQLLETNLSWAITLSSFLSLSDKNIMHFLDLFNVSSPPLLLVGLLIVSHCIKETIYSSRLSHYLVDRLTAFLPYLYNTCILHDTMELGFHSHEISMRLYKFIESNCGIGYSGFLLTVFTEPLFDVNITDIVASASETIKSTDIRIATGDLFKVMFNKCSRSNGLFIPAIAASISPMITMRVAPMTLKYSLEKQLFSTDPIITELTAKIVSKRLRGSSTDFSSQGFFQVLKPLLEKNDVFINKFLDSDSPLPFRDVYNFSIVFELPRDTILGIAVNSLENEEISSNLFVASLGNVLLLIEGESIHFLLSKFMTKVGKNAYCIGEQWREQCSKSIWKCILVDTDSIVDILIISLENNVCALAAGYLSAKGFTENPELTIILQKCLLVGMSKINLSLKSFAKDYVNILSILQCEWAIVEHSLTVRRIAKFSQDVANSIHKKIANINPIQLNRLQAIEKFATKVLTLVSN